MEKNVTEYKRPHSTWCSAANCLNQRGARTGISFFMFPASPERCKSWAINAGRPDLEKRAVQDCKNIRKDNALCEEHFHRDQFMCPAEKGVLNKRKRLMPKAIPTLFGLEGTKMVAGNGIKLEEPNVLKTGTKTNGKLSIREQLIEALMASEFDSVTDPDILLSNLIASQKIDPDSCLYSIMKAVTDSGDTYFAVPLTTDGSSSEKSVLSEIIAGDFLECEEPLHPDPMEVAKLKDLLKKKSQFIQHLKFKVQALKTLKKNYEKPDGIIKLASTYLDDDDLVAFASKLRSSSKTKGPIQTERDEQFNNDT